MFRSALIAATLCAVLAASPALAGELTAGSLKIASSWARATPKGAAVGGGYLKITNTGTMPDRLIGGSTGAARTVEIHSMIMEGGIMKMRPVTGGLEIKPGQTVELKPGGYHVMFIGLNKPLEKGEKVEVTLEFKNAGKVNVTFVVEGIGAQSGGGGHDSGHSTPGAPMKH